MSCVDCGHSFTQATTGLQFANTNSVGDLVVIASAKERKLTTELARLQRVYNDLGKTFEEQACPGCGRHRPYCDCLDVAIAEIERLRNGIKALRMAVSKDQTIRNYVAVQLAALIREPQEKQDA